MGNPFGDELITRAPFVVPRKRAVRIFMLYTLDQLAEGQSYNLPMDEAEELIARRIARPCDPSEFKPTGPSEFKKKKHG